MTTHPRAGQPAQDSDLIDVAALVTAYYTGHPDVTEPAQRVAFAANFAQLIFDGVNGNGGKLVYRDPCPPYAIH